MIECSPSRTVVRFNSSGRAITHDKQIEGAKQIRALPDTEQTI
jgi:hypothetical protein